MTGAVRTIPIGLLDYGVGNLGSLAASVRRVGGRPVRVRRKAQAELVRALILPGVGAMAPAAASLAERGLGDLVREWALAGKPVLGICLGMQLLFGESEEGGQGLRLLPGTTRRLSGRVPHFGWSRVEPVEDTDPLRPWQGSGAYAYFAHEYAVVPDQPEVVAGWCARSSAMTPDMRFVAAVSHGAISGVQFHPERSGEAGESVLRSLLDRVREVKA